MKKDKVGAYIIILIVLIIGGYLTIRYSTNLKEIKMNRSITSGQVYNYRDRGSKYSGGTMYFTYYIEGTTHKSEELYLEIEKGYEQIFIGKIFPVLYATNDIKNCKILVTPNDFNKFNIPFPDSLQWVLKYVKG